MPDLYDHDDFERKVFILSDINGRTSFGKQFWLTEIKLFYTDPNAIPNSVSKEEKDEAKESHQFNPRMKDKYYKGQHDTWVVL